MTGPRPVNKTAPANPAAIELLNGDFYVVTPCCTAHVNVPAAVADLTVALQVRCRLCPLQWTAVVREDFRYGLRVSWRPPS